MKPIILFILIALTFGRADEKALLYATKRNTSGYPFPSAFPDVPNERILEFDWKRYIREAVSEGDRIFRSNIAFTSGFEDVDTRVTGVLVSASDEAARNRIAAEELSKCCLLIEETYRERLKKDAELLGFLEEFIVHHRKAIELSVRLVGGSWDGGSGARVAYPGARLAAFCNYRAALLELRSSLHLQDMPDVVFPAPDKISAK